MRSSLVRPAGGPRPSGRYRGTAKLPLLALTLLLLSQLFGSVHPAGAAPPKDAGGVHTLTGEVTVTNPFILSSRTDPYVLLADVSQWFVYADEPAPPGQQILAGLDGVTEDPAGYTATYTLSLPIAPKGGPLDVDNGEGEGDGVQVYLVQMVTDAVGDPFVGPLDGAGYMPYLSSLVVWAPDDAQFFPSDAGEDGQLFTGDDPVAPLGAGWTVVDLDGDEFAFERAGTIEVPLLETAGSHTDLAGLDYVDAFDALVADLRGRYAFTEVKDIDFDALVEEFRPLVVAAERDDDPEAFAVALLRFARMFGDGHVAVNIRNGLFDDYLTDRYGGSPGLEVAETDDGEVIVIAVTPDSPAAEAGIEPGTEIVAWNGDPIEEALENVEQMRGHSSPHGLRWQQLRLLPRLPIGEEVALAVRNPGERDSETIELEAVADPVGLEEVRGIRHPNRESLPVTFEVLPSGVGYIKVNAFSDEVALTYDAWEWALKRMDALAVPALIVDVRGNGGGSGTIAQQFAGAFVDEAFVLATDYTVAADGELELAGPSRIEPSALRWEKPVTVLIDQRCASACEIFAAAMAEAGHPIVGHGPTAGVEAGVLPWTLPEGLQFRASVYLMLDAEGEIFLEGVGLPPTIAVPCTAESLVSPEDEVLLVAEAELLDQVEDR